MRCRDLVEAKEIGYRHDEPAVSDIPKNKAHSFAVS